MFNLYVYVSDFFQKIKKLHTMNITETLIVLSEMHCNFSIDIAEKKQLAGFCDSAFHTLKEVQVILIFATVAKNSDWSSQWSSMRKDILNDVEELGRVVCKIILQKYTWLWIDLSDILIFTVYLGIDQIFTDYPTGSKEKFRKWQKIYAICLLPVG